MFCYRVKACTDTAAAECSDFSAGVIGFHKPPRKVEVTINAPNQARPGETVTMQSYADSAGYGHRIPLDSIRREEGHC